VRGGWQLPKKHDGSSAIDLWCATEELCTEWATDLPQVRTLNGSSNESLCHLNGSLPITTEYSDHRLTCGAPPGSSAPNGSPTCPRCGLIFVKADPSESP
jgi:hypothetical protein